MFGLIGHSIGAAMRGSMGGGVAGALAGRLRGRGGSGSPVTSPMQPMTGAVAGSPLGGADASKLPAGDTAPDEVRTLQRGIDVNRPMDYRGQLSDLRRSTTRNQRRAGRSLSR